MKPLTLVLIRKLLRDYWIPLVVVALLLLAFECLWARVTQRITTELLPDVTGFIMQEQQKTLFRLIPPDMTAEEKLRLTRDLQKLAARIDPKTLQEEQDRISKELQQLAFKGPGKLVQSLIGGESIDLKRAQDTLSVGYVHPLIQVILCIWAIGRASGAITGEIDRGTMELLLAQPVPRWKLVAAHLCVDGITIPALCLSLWAGVWLGTWTMGLLDQSDPLLQVDPAPFGPALLMPAALMFAVSGTTMFFSSLGRFRGRVMGLVVLATLIQFLVNLLAQIWDAIDFLRPWTVFYYYQPQAIILHPHDWWHDGQVWLRLGVLAGVGAAGYALALAIFSRRDLPAPL